MIFSSNYLSTDSSTATTSSSVNMLKSLNSVHLPPPPHASGLRPAAVLDSKALKRSVSSIGFVQKRQSTYSSFSASTTPKQQFAQVRSVSLGTPASNSKAFVNTLSAVIAQPAFCTGRIMVMHLLAHKLPYGHNID